MTQFDRNRQSGPFREPQHLPHVKAQDEMARLLGAVAQRPDRVPEDFLAYLLDYMRINLLLRDVGLTLSDVTNNDVSSSRHGFVPKSPADATKFLNGAAVPAFAQVKDSDLSTSDITTNNVSTSKHGFAPKGGGTGTAYLDDTGAYTTPAGGSSTPDDASTIIASEVFA